MPASAGQENQPAAGKPTERRSIRAADYKKLEIPEGRSVCYCCGGKGAWYVEKLTAERKARPKDQQDARRICKVCYLESARKYRAGTPPLPGIIFPGIDGADLQQCGPVFGLRSGPGRVSRSRDRCPALRSLLFKGGNASDAEETGGWEPMTVPAALLSHTSTDHYTPQYILDAVIACMEAIDLDPCSNSREIPNVPAARHYTAQDNGLMRPWIGRVFINPPFGYDVELWFSKLYLERLEGRTTEAIVLWKSATETAAWKTLTQISCRVCFPSTRIRFVGPSGDDGTGPTFSPALFYTGDRPEWFENAFRSIGDVWITPKFAGRGPERGIA